MTSSGSVTPVRVEVALVVRGFLGLCVRYTSSARATVSAKIDQIIVRAFGTDFGPSKQLEAMFGV